MRDRLTPELQARFKGLRRLIGNTPLLAIDYRFRGRRGRVYAKAENFNMTGSVKDRMALHILHRAYERGTIEPGAPIVEATSGNAGVSFAAVGRALGHGVSIFIPDWTGSARVNLLRSFGAELHPVLQSDGGFVGSIAKAEETAQVTAGAFFPRQFANEDNSEAHELTTGPEIHWQLGEHGLRPDAFVAGVGTGGTVMGTGRYLKAHHPHVAIHPIEPASSPTLSTGRREGTHRIAGLCDEFVPPILDLALLDRVVAVDDGDAIRMARSLARNLGLGVGISSGANFLGAVEIQAELGPDAVVVTIFPDSNRHYLSTEILQHEPALPNHLEPHVTLLGFTSINRACTACDAADRLLPMGGVAG